MNTDEQVHASEHLRLTRSGPASEQGAHAAQPSSVGHDLSNRLRTSAHVDWYPMPSTSTHELLYTPDVSPIVHEIVSQPGWAPNSPMAFLSEWVSGTGSRWVEAYRVNPMCAAPRASSPSSHSNHDPPLLLLFSTSAL